MGSLGPIFDSEQTELHQEKGVVAWGSSDKRRQLGSKTITLLGFRPSLTTHANIPFFRHLKLRDTGNESFRGLIRPVPTLPYHPKSDVAFGADVARLSDGCVLLLRQSPA